MRECSPLTTKETWVRKFLIPAVALLLITAACGGGKNKSSLTNSETSASPGATASAAPGKSAAPAKNGAKTATGGATTGSKSGSASKPTSAAAPKVVSGGYAPPKDGSYTYRLDGEATNPFNPASPPQKFSNESLTKKISHSGNVITTEQTTSTSAGTSTQKVRWEADRVLLLYVNASTPQGDYGCTFNPPLLITRFPVRPGTIPTQHFKGSGNACNGTLDITIERREAAKDANGKSWDAWRVRVKTSANAGQFTQNSDDTRWVSPVLAEEVRSTGTFTLTIKGAAGSGSSHGSQTTALKSYPK
jgi:hypothetical protein